MEQCRPVRLLPVFGGEGGLNFALYGIGKIIEKIVTGAGLYLIYRVGIVEHAAPALVICVWHNKAYGLPFAFALHTEHFKETGGHRYPIFANLFVSRLYYRAATDIDCGLLGQCTAALLYALPNSSVEAGTLRADIAKVETLVHSPLAPAHICSGGHMSSAVARFCIVRVPCRAPSDKRVGFKLPVWP